MFRSHYKNTSQGHRGETCLLCQTETRGPTTEVHIAHGIRVWLCRIHASHDFRVSRSGRDLQLSLHKAWKSAGCLTARHVAALNALRRDVDAETLAAAAQRARNRPGSYHWPYLRRLVEQACAKGVTRVSQLLEICAKHWSVEIRRGRATLPSLRTLRRWRGERRWDEPGWHAPGSAAGMVA